MEQPPTVPLPALGAQDGDADEGLGQVMKHNNITTRMVVLAKQQVAQVCVTCCPSS